MAQGFFDIFFKLEDFFYRYNRKVYNLSLDILYFNKQ